MVTALRESQAAIPRILSPERRPRRASAA
jgi:hypothetical protein